MKRISKVLILIGGIICIVIGVVFLKKLPIPSNFDNTIKPEIWGQFGDIIGGVVGTIFSLVGIFLLIETLRGGERAQIESKIFELIKFHRENINEITNDFEGGRLLFKKIVEEIEIIYKKVNDCECKMKDENEIDYSFEDKDKLNVAYLIAFFGLNLEKNQALKAKVCSFTDCNNLMEKALECIPELKNDLKDTNENYNIHIGYQFVLGHYYRHLYQTVTYVNSLKTFNYQEKYFYIKTLRAHLSTYEQILFFYNSVSSLGMVWELEPQPKKKLNLFYKILYALLKYFPGYYIKKKFDIENYNKKLITKYNIIKNIPDGFSAIYASKIYPNVEYEGMCKSEEKEKHEKYYT